MYRKYHLLTGLTCKLRVVPLVSEITPVKLSHIVFPVYLEIWKISDSFKNKIKLRTLKSRNLMPFFSYLCVKIAKIEPPRNSLSPKWAKLSTNKVPKELHSWLIPCLYPAYTLPIPKYLEILVTALCMSVEIGNFQVTLINKSFRVKGGWWGRQSPTTWYFEKQQTLELCQRGV